MRRFLTLLVFLVLSGAGYYFYVGFSRADLPEVSYRLGHLDRGDIIASVSATGTINPTSTILVGTQMSGLVVAILADYNSEVKANSVVARLDSTQVRAKLDAARAELAQAQAQARVQKAGVQKNLADTNRAKALLADAVSQLARVDVQLADAALTLSRQNELKLSGVATGVALQAAKTAVDSVRAQRASAAAQIDSAHAAIASLEADRLVAEAQIAAAEAGAMQKQAMVRQIEVDLENTEIRSPVDGVVVQRSIELGQTVAASLQAPTLFQIAQDLREMEIYANVDESDVGRVQPGQAVSFTVNAWPGRNFEGLLKLVRLGSQTVQNVVIYTAIVSVKNPKLELKPGMTANLRILTDRRESVLRVPNAALRWKPAGTPPESGNQQASGSLFGQPAIPGYGQPQGGSGQRASTEFAEAIKSEIKPGAEQQSQIDTIFARMRGQHAQLAAGENDPSARRQRMRALREAAASEIAALLSPEQRSLFDGLRERMAAGRQGDSAGVGQSGRVFVTASGKPEIVPLRIGATDGAFTEILSGALEENREVIIGGGAKPGPSGLLPGPPPGGRMF